MRSELAFSMLKRRRWIVSTVVAAYLFILVTLSSNDVLQPLVRKQDLVRPTPTVFEHWKQQQHLHALFGVVDRWPHFNGTCGTLLGREAVYTDVRQVPTVSCIDVCNSVTRSRCKAVTVNAKTGLCRLASECTIRIHAENEVTIVLPDGDLIQNDEHEDQVQSDCEGTCPAAGPCAEPFVCRSGRCFRGPNFPDMTPCDDGDELTTDDVCRAGVCQGRHSPLDDFVVTMDVRCMRRSDVRQHIQSVEHCALECRHQGSGCTAFSWRDGECQLFNQPSPQCRLKGHGWVSGVSTTDVTTT
eukprot:m.438298 g.438298  ORF g.438298 m.438298 type:complete len:299 (+) comp18221_c0_seq1:378-1274(+)